jgi:HEAT repeat protein
MTVHDPSAFHGREGDPAARRKAAAAASGHLGDEGAARAALTDDDAGVRAAALGALVRLGAATLDDLARAFADDAPSVRRRAAELAWRTTIERDDLVALVSQHLVDGEGEVVEAVCFCLGELRPARPGEALTHVAQHHSDALCRESAVAALGAIGDPGSLPVILDALKDRPPIRRRAVIALAAFEGPAVDAALQAALEDRDWQVRQAAEDLTTARASDG